MSKKWLIVVVIINVIINNLVEFAGSELLSVAVLFRHGCRTPKRLCKNDPYNNKILDIWPEGLSQLTNLGKNQQYNLGKWYREFYKDFIPENYDPKFLKVISSDEDRCLMSAAVNLAGLFPPKGEQVWNPNILWQPIPIHTIPREHDSIILNEMYCKKFDKLYKALLKSEEHKKYIEEKQELFKYLTKHAGETISSPEDATFIHDSLFIEDYYNLTIPEWSRNVFPSQTEPLLTKVYSLQTNTTDLAKLKIGPLVDYITSFFENVIKDPSNSQKFLMMSVHDSTIGPLLSSLNVSDNTWPEYASTLIFELRRKQCDDFLNIRFKNSTMMRNITLHECGIDCDFAKFRKMINPIRITAADKEKECLNG